MHTYERTPTEGDINQKSNISLQYHKTIEQVDCDSRISNIEKINVKIKKILDTGSGVATSYQREMKEKTKDLKTLEKNSFKTPNTDKKELKLNLNFIDRQAK